MAISRAFLFVFAAFLFVNIGTTVVAKTKEKITNKTKEVNVNLPKIPNPLKPPAGYTHQPGPDETLGQGQANPLGASQVSRNMLTNYNIQLTPQVSAPEPSLALDCQWLCKERCKDSERNQCMSACQLCCNRCRCVPPGTSGNKEKCGKCYDEQSIIYGYKVTCP